MVEGILGAGLSVCRQSLNNTKGSREPAEYFTKLSSLEHVHRRPASPLDILFPAPVTPVPCSLPASLSLYPQRSSSNVISSAKLLFPHY